jgi:drug/metabolite transporter (DMT)-like permease
VTAPPGGSRDVVRRGYAEVVLGICLFSSAGVFIRELHLPAPVIVSGQAFVTLAILLASRCVNGFRPTLRITHGLPLVLTIALVLALDQLCFTVGVGMTNVATIVILAYLYPVFTALLSARVLGERAGRRLVMALTLAVVGTALVLSPSIRALAGSDVVAVGLGVTVAFLVAVYRVLVKKIDACVPTTTLAVYTTLVIALIYSPSFFLAEYSLTWTRLGLLVVSALLTTTAAGLLVLSGVRRVDANRAAVLSYIEPFVAALLAWLFLAESPSPLLFVGGALIVAGGLLVVRASPPGEFQAVVH